MLLAKATVLAAKLALGACTAIIEHPAAALLVLRWLAVLVFEVSEQV
jgi:hypothetical protein